MWFGGQREESLLPAPVGSGEVPGPSQGYRAQQAGDAARLECGAGGDLDEGIVDAVLGVLATGAQGANESQEALPMRHDQGPRMAHGRPDVLGFPSIADCASVSPAHC